MRLAPSCAAGPEFDGSPAPSRPSLPRIALMASVFALSALPRVCTLSRTLRAVSSPKLAIFPAADSTA